MGSYRKAKRQVAVSPGESVRIIRQLQEMSQNDLAGASGIPQSTISAIECERINLGVESAKQLARALKCHPAILVRSPAVRIAVFRLGVRAVRSAAAQVPDLGAVAVHLVDDAVALAVGGERDAAAVRRPAGVVLPRRMA